MGFADEIEAILQITATIAWPYSDIMLHHLGLCATPTRGWTGTLSRDQLSVDMKTVHLWKILLEGTERAY